MYIPNIFLLILCNFQIFFTFVLVYVSAFMWLFVCKCVVVQLSVIYGNLNICLRGLLMMRTHSFLNFIFLVIREKDEFYILSLESVTSIQKPMNLLKVVYHHPVSCLLHHYITSEINNQVCQSPLNYIYKLLSLNMFKLFQQNGKEMLLEMWYSDHRLNKICMVPRRQFRIE